MFFTKIAKYMCIFTLIMLPNFSFAAMHGLKGYYYDNYNFTDLTCKHIGTDGPTGTPYRSITDSNGDPFRDENGNCYYVDPNIDFGWGDGMGIPPYKNHPEGKPIQTKRGNCCSRETDYFSMRWRGFLRIPKTDNYNFFIKYKTSYHLKIDGRTIFDKKIAGLAHEWRRLNIGNASEDYAVITGGYHSFSLDYKKGTGNGFIRLGYTVNNPFPKQDQVKLIPDEWFFTEVPHKVSFDQPVFSVKEGEGDINVSVTIDKLPTCPNQIKVGYETFDKDASFPRRAIAGKDYTKAKGELVWNCNDDLSKTFHVNVLSSLAPKSTQLFDINLSELPNNIVYIKKPNATGQIYGEGSDIEVEFGQPSYVVREGNILAVPVMLNKPAPKDFTVGVQFKDITTKYGEDYLPINSYIFFKKGSKVSNLNIRIIDEKHMESSDEDFMIKLSTPPSGIYLGTNDTTIVTIIDSQNINLCFSQNDSKGDAIKDGWKLLHSSHPYDETTFRKNVVNDYGDFLKFWQVNVTKPYYAKHPINGTSRLRLSEGLENETFAVTYDPGGSYSGFRGKDNYIVIEFDHYAYAGCVNKPGNLTPANANKYGGDGMAMVLYDANVTNPQPGAFGGALGYAQRGGFADNHHPGFTKGWLGLGLDEFGSFGISGRGGWYGQGKWAGIKTGNEGPVIDAWNATPSHTVMRNKITLRGSGDGQDGYRYLASSIAFDEDKGEVPIGRWALPSPALLNRVSNVENSYKYSEDELVFMPLPFPFPESGVRELKNGLHPKWAKQYVDDQGTQTSYSTARPTDYFSGRYRLSIDNRFDGHTYIMVERYIPKPADYKAGKVVDEKNMDWEVVISEIDVQDPSYAPHGGHLGQDPLPEYLKLAFTSSSGGSCNIREIGNIVIKANDCGVQEQANNFRVIEEEYAKMDATKAKVNATKLWNWKWNSPLRTKIARNEGKYCILSGNSNDENATAATEDRKVKVYIMKKGRDADSLTLMDSHMGILVTPPESFGTDVNGTFTITNANASNPTAYCFEYPKNPIADSANEEISSDLYFSVIEYGSQNQPLDTIGVSSSDYFSIRPKQYNIKFTDKDTSTSVAPTNDEIILMSGKDYEYNINSVYFDSNNSTFGYFKKLDSRAVDKYFSKFEAILEENGTTLVCPVDTNLTIGKETIVDSNLFRLAFRNGDVKFESHDGVISPSSSMSFNYDNTMKFDPAIKDTEWTMVDFNMTKISDSNLTTKEQRIEMYGLECIPDINKFNSYHHITIDQSDINRTRELGQNIFCDINETYPSIYVIPSHFDVQFTSLTDAVKRADGNFTYVADKNLTAPHMAADINLTIQTMSANNHITTNYQNQCYANDVDFNISFVRNDFDLSDRTVANFNDTNRSAKSRIWYDGDTHKYPDKNTSHFISKKDINATFRVPSDKFSNGEISTSVNFNFGRLANVPYEPFKINQDDFNLTHITDINYTDRVTNININGKDKVKGGHTKNNSSVLGGFKSRPLTADTSTSTFYYGRAYTPENYKGAIDTDIKGSTYFLAYCLTCDKTALNIMTNWPLRLGVAWYQNMSHNKLFPDGNITNYESTNGYAQDTVKVQNISSQQSSSNISNGEEEVVFRSSTPGIDMVKMHASPWLIFNESNSTADTVDFPVEFFGTGGDWAGQGSIINIDTREKGKIVGTTSIDINNTSDRVQDRIEW